MPVTHPGTDINTLSTRDAAFVAFRGRAGGHATISWRLTKCSRGAESGKVRPFTAAIVLRITVAVAGWSGHGAWWMSRRYGRCLRSM
jgi:hypothetical protein